MDMQHRTFLPNAEDITAYRDMHGCSLLEAKRALVRRNVVDTLETVLYGMPEDSEGFDARDVAALLYVVLEELLPQ